MKCPVCESEWAQDCEQAICVEIHGRCFSCRIREGKEIDIERIKRTSRQRELEKWGRALAAVPSGSMGEYCMGRVEGKQ